MVTITVPKELGKNKDLVAVPRKSYEAFLAWQKGVKSKKTFAPAADEKKRWGAQKRILLAETTRRSKSSGMNWQILVDSARRFFFSALNMTRFVSIATKNATLVGCTVLALSRS